MGQDHAPEALAKIIGVECPDVIKVPSQFREDRGGQGRDAVLSAFSLTNSQLASFQVDILDTELNALEQAHAAAVEHGDDQSRRPGKLREYCSYFVTSQDRGQGRRRAHPGDLRDRREWCAQHLAVQEQECRQWLVLGGGADVAVNGQGREEPRDIVGRKFLRMPFAVEGDELSDPVAVGVLGTVAEMANATRLADALHQAGRLEIWRRHEVGRSEGRAVEKWPLCRQWYRAAVSFCCFRGSRRGQNPRPPTAGYLTATRNHYAGQLTMSVWFASVGDTKTEDCRDSRSALDSRAFYLIVSLTESRS